MGAAGAGDGTGSRSARGPFVGYGTCNRTARYAAEYVLILAIFVGMVAVVLIALDRTNPER